MALTNPYCSVQEVREQLDRAGDPGGKIPQAGLERAINATSRAVDKYCSGDQLGITRRFWQDPAPVAHVFWVDDPCRAWVDDFSDKASLTVKTDDDDDGVFETTWTIDVDFQLEPLNADLAGTPFAWWEIVAIGQRRFPLYPQRAGLQVTTRFGWSAISDGVNQASILKSAKLFLRRDSPDGWRGMADFGPVRISRYEDPDVAGLLEPFLKKRSRTLNYTPQRFSLFHGGR